MERILLATDYPNLTKLKLFYFKKEIISHYFTNESPLRYIFQQQITNLILVNHDTSKMIGSLKNYTLTIMETFYISHPGLILSNLPSTTFSSSTLTQLCIDVYTLDDCLYLLDGRLKQLATLIVRIHYIDNSSTIVHNMDNLPNLKCLSLKSYIQVKSYDNTVLPLLRRMSYLEKLTLYLRIEDRDRFIDGTHLENEILINMSQLHSFTFYICTYIDTVNLIYNLSNEDVQRTFINIGQQHIASIINYIDPKHIVCSIFSIPFTFDRLEDIGNIFPNIIFSYVTYLSVKDVVPFNREFFIRVARAFPLLKTFRILNYDSQPLCNLNSSQSYEIAEYRYLIYLDMLCGNINYLEQFLNEEKTYVPRLTKLKVVYNNLRIVTNNFTRKEMRRNCAKIKQLLMISYRCMNSYDTKVLDVEVNHLRGFDFLTHFYPPISSSTTRISENDNIKLTH
ncbi:unnamed protein product [Rotaria sordida]|uniref:Uncharacterized protein n=1 Tax=Rotaria sordida TaxID=392033 RepID=A0A815M0X6_9BILA|nr:unnamed protein product [Rotaria sordida]CAF4014581.1 unnamed protein product [Rotaria sordida]